MSAFSTTLALFVNRAYTKAAMLSLESVDTFIFGKEKKTERLVNDVYHLLGGIQAVSTESKLGPSQKLRIAQQLTQCYALNQLVFIEGNQLAIGGQITVDTSQSDHNKLFNVNPLSAFPDPLHVTAEQIARWDAGSEPSPVPPNTGILYGGSYYPDDSSTSPFDFILQPTKWQFLGVPFTLLDEHFTVLPAADGSARIDLPVLNNAGDLVIITGTEVVIPGATFTPSFDQASQLPLSALNVTEDSSGQSTNGIPTQYIDSRNGLIGNLFELPDETAVRTDLIGSDVDEFTEKLFLRLQDDDISWEVRIDPFTGEKRIVGINESGGSPTYQGAQPTNVQWGAINPGTNLVGLTHDAIIEMATITYLLPAFSSFGISGQATLIQVGIALSGTKTFTWATTNSGNVAANTIAIRDVTTSTLIATGLANDGTEAVAIGTITNTSPISHSWRSEGANSNAGSFVSTPFVVISVYPVFYGKVASGGAAAGANRPASNQALINSGTEVTELSTGTITINFGSTSDDYFWFAIPATSTTKTVWFVTALNTGTIGGAVSPGGNLFPAPDTVSIDSPGALWTGVSYKIFVANYQSAIAVNMELRNS